MPLSGVGVGVGPLSRSSDTSPVYCALVDGAYFVGAVGLVNSLRLAGAAEDGAIAVIADMRTRWFAEWEQIFELREPVRSSSSYADGSFVALSTSRWQWFLDRWYEVSQQVAVSRAGQPFLLRWKEAESNPIGFNEQDIRNALLMSEVPEFAVRFSPHSLTPIYDARRRTRVVDAETRAARPMAMQLSFSTSPGSRNRGSRVAGSGSGSARSTGC